MVTPGIEAVECVARQGSASSCAADAWKWREAGTQARALMIERAQLPVKKQLAESTRAHAETPWD
jgi:hypothetical protein